ncbi:sensor histidine kinase [Pseudomonas sp. EpS/L25]|uniref:sensor histidine kinase n=1 Tax=Pseudomonas sp. EpS/L25 TaxID=1749078 RepID=UPI0007440BCE|nr:ATP-binding protein [Pseudomonas sp. EpS/L25]KUM43086.1 histidine kinase [Pseudomonas sp. EpS/L25]
MRRLDTLFARLFGVFLLAILLGHLLAFFWFRHEFRDRPPPRPPLAMREAPFERPPPPPERLPDKEPNWWRRVEWLLGGPLVFQLGSLVIAAWLGARLLTRPLRQLTQTAEQLSHNLDGSPIPVTGPWETREAARALNRMHQHLLEQIQQRGRMLTAISHDLRTPLARVKLRIEDIDDPRLHARVSQDVDDMIALLDGTLRYLREQHREECPVLCDVQALVEAMAEDAEEEGAQVSVEGTCVPLWVAPMALRSCLTNLLQNALRYAGHAEIHLVERSDRLVIRIVDHGPGIPAALHEAVFEPFYRLEGSRNRSSGGTGLGLAIAREAAAHMGGELSLEETPGGGLTCQVTMHRPPS